MSYAEYPAGKVTVQNTSYDIYVTDTGTFLTYFDGNRLHAESRAKVVEQLTKEAKKKTAKVAVPFTTIGWKGSKPVIQRGIATGIHSSNHNVLVRWVDTGKTEQVDRYGGREYMGELTTRDAEIWTELIEARQAAQKALDTFQKEHKLNLRDAVAAELEKAVKE